MPGIIDPVGAPEPSDPGPSWPARLAWFALLAAGGVLVTGLLAGALHALMRI